MAQSPETPLWQTKLIAIHLPSVASHVLNDFRALHSHFDTHTVPFMQSCCLTAMSCK